MASSPKMEHCALEELMPLVEESFSMNRKVHFHPNGISMKPMLVSGRDSVLLSPIRDEIRKYDVVLYRYDNGKYVMHRVVKTQGDCFICLGDNTERFERVEARQMLAVVTEFTRKGKTISVTSPLYRLYCRLWRPTRPLRILYKRAKRLLRRCFK